MYATELSWNMKLNDGTVANVDKSIWETGEGRHLLQDRLKDSRFESGQSVVVQIHPRLVAIAVACITSH